MNTPIRPTFVVAVAFLLIACILGLRFACDPSALRALIQEDRRREQLLQLRRSSHRHSEAKWRVMQEVIDQRCSLSEALARLQELDCEWLQELERELPDAASGLWLAHRLAWSYPDHYYRLITIRAADLLTDRPEEAAAVLNRLEKDYRQLQCHLDGDFNCREDAAPNAK